MKQTYITKKFQAKTLDLIDTANTVVVEYQAQGFNLTLRQLYYQLVARDFIPNNDREYKKLSKTISNARLAGLVDWGAIVDRTRVVRSLPHWKDEPGILDAVAKQFRVDKWERQEHKPRVWIEKDALIGVIEGVCNDLDVPYLACRGYMSSTTVWEEAQMIGRQLEDGQRPVVIHLGDHDPSGIDMTRDIEDRLATFEAAGCEVIRIALNFDQVQQYSPPPNPTKMTDSRAGDYTDKYGASSWELDALDPSTISNLVEDTILSFRNDELWNKDSEREQTGRDMLTTIQTRYDDVKRFLQNGTLTTFWRARAKEGLMNEHQQRIARLRDNIVRYEAGELEDQDVIDFFIELWNTSHILKLPPLYREEFNHLHNAGHIALSKNGEASIGESDAG